jgi:glycosyltransferase involved in cell wall biosynthesis
MQSLCDECSPAADATRPARPSLGRRPLVSTVIPTHRRAEMLPRAVRSVLEQRYSNIEVLVVDDNTEASEQRLVRQALAPFGERVKLLRNTRAKGACGARNTGILAARGDLIAFLDDDDRWLPDKLTEQILLFANRACVGALCCYIEIDVAFGHAVNCRRFKPVLTREMALAGECPSSTSLALVRRDVLVDAGLFDETLPSFQDYDMWLRCLAFGELRYAESPLVEFVQHCGERTSVNIEKRLRGLAAFERKWGPAMSAFQDIEAFRRRMHVDALIANGRAALAYGHAQALAQFARAAWRDRMSVRSAFWLTIGLLGPRAGRALYRWLLQLRRVEILRPDQLDAESVARSLRP